MRCSRAGMLRESTEATHSNKCFTTDHWKCKEHSEYSVSVIPFTTRAWVRTCPNHRCRGRVSACLMPPEATTVPWNHFRALCSTIYSLHSSSHGKSHPPWVHNVVALRVLRTMHESNADSRQKAEEGGMPYKKPHLFDWHNSTISCSLRQTAPETQDQYTSALAW